METNLEKALHEYKTKRVWCFVSNNTDSRILHSTMERIDKRILFNYTSRSIPYTNKTALIKYEGLLEKPCKRCGRIVNTNYIESIKEELVERNICFDCYFWEEKLLIKDNPEVARINGSHYIIAPDNPNSYFKGFGGAKFIIQFNDGRLVTTHNLWWQGTIPKHFKKLLPDNAIFITEE